MYEKVIMYFFRFNILPIPKQSVRQGTTWDGKNIFYQDIKFKKYEKELLRQLQPQIPKEFKILDGYLAADVLYVFPPLKSLRKSDLDLIEKGHLLYKNTKPDLMDNLNKAVFDSLAGHLFTNDSRICDFHARKLIGKSPAILLKLYDIENRDFGIINTD